MPGAYEKLHVRVDLDAIDDVSRTADGTVALGGGTGGFTGFAAGSLAGRPAGNPPAGVIEAHADVHPTAHAVMIHLVRTLDIPFAFMVNVQERGATGL